MSNKKLLNILSCVAAGAALVLIVLVVLVKTGVIKPYSNEEETEIVSEVIVVSETNEHGEVEYLTMVTRYTKPKISSDHSYAFKPTTTKKNETTEVKYVEQSSVIHVTDANGIPLFNDDGSPVTEVVTYTVREDSITTTTKAPPKTSAVIVTDESGNQQTDANGKPVTEVITYTEPSTTKEDIWSSNTKEDTTGILNIETEITREDGLAQTVVNQINADREAAGLAPLEHTVGLKASARTNCYVLARPEYYGNNQVSGAYTLVTPYGGSPIYQTIAAAKKDKIMSEETTQIGVGIIKYNDKYYTTVIFG